VTTTYQFDLAISAVSFDTAFVSELSDHLAFRVRAPIVWLRDAEVGAVARDIESPLAAQTSRVVVVLHQRLWRHDATTRLDEVALRERLAHRSDSVCVVMLDDQPVPRWLESADHCDLATAGLDGVVEFIVGAIDAGGGRPHSAKPSEPLPTQTPMWRDGPPPFLRQPRAFSTLRRELDTLADELAPKPASKHAGPAAVELHALPSRLVLRVEDVGISFSWVAGPLGTVADGRLMVIQWDGVAPSARGSTVLRAATAVRERVYHVEGDGPEHWRWRLDGPNGRACSTKNLAGEWLAAASMATSAALSERAAP
jgi:hypothetical protein